MSFEPILHNVSKHIQLNSKEIELFTSYLTEKRLGKGQVLLEQGAFCDGISFVNNGILRAYFLSEEGKETTIMFAIKDWWVTDMFAFTKKKKSMLSIEALEPSMVFLLSKVNFERLLLEIPKFERFFRILMQNAYIREQQRGLENLSLTAKKKYDIFMEKYPSIASQLNQKQIASYLGITPEFLSMVRNGK
ncbi:Crp/Fnr family transcriptional regulator [uncultured Allomuricauda sp.]|uniref:Crp/Fnr family transcriptional regulator n=1 Tax=Allomuricauda sp. R78024 TaxID=3093867 RepID=UPI00263849EC|nr:Crp/Fnr family transcriptional regulator [uncultured Allomuricauda sp.]